MGKKLNYLAGIYLLSIFICGCSGAFSLLELKSELNNQDRILKIQKKNFQNIRVAIKKNRLTHGMGADYVIKKYGQPVVRIFEEENQRTRWVYAEDTFSFKNPRVYLYFDSDDKLISWLYQDETP